MSKSGQMAQVASTTMSEPVKEITVKHLVETTAYSYVLIWKYRYVTTVRETHWDRGFDKTWEIMEFATRNH